jgi:hypothetical protein
MVLEILENFLQEIKQIKIPADFTEGFSALILTLVRALILTLVRAY